MRKFYVQNDIKTMIFNVKIHSIPCLKNKPPFLILISKFYSIFTNSIPAALAGLNVVKTYSKPPPRPLPTSIISMFSILTILIKSKYS